MEEKKGWSWLGFLFMPYYYAGYGALQKGIIFAILAGIIARVPAGTNMTLLVIIFLIGLGIAIYGGMNAKKELPVGKQKFSWKNVIIAAVAYTMAMVVSMFIFLTLLTPNQEIETIKQSKLEMCSTATVEEMVDSFFGDPSWESDSTEEDVKFVNISGDITYADKPVRAVIQFTFSKDETSFEYQAFEINEVPQNQFIASSLLQKMCESAK